MLLDSSFMSSTETNNHLWPLPERTQWTGNWIWSDARASARNVYAQFRRTFQTESDGQLTLRLAADSSYQLYVDGRRIARGPSRGHLDWYPFDTHELSLGSGCHTIAVLVHHIGVVNASVMTGRPGLLADLTWTGTDGEIVDYSTGPAWKSQPGTAWREDLPCLMSHFGFWEECDLRQLSPQWVEPEFDDSTWSSAIELDTSEGLPWKHLVDRDIPMPELSPRAVQAVRASGTFIPGEVEPDTESKRQSIAGGWLESADTREIPSKQAAVRVRSEVAGGIDFSASQTLTPGTGIWQTVDFGGMVSGYPEVVIESDSEDVFIDLSYDDITGENGAVNPERTYARMTDRYRLRRGRNFIRPVNPRGFRYLMLDCFGEGTLRVVRVSAEDELYPFGQAATFTCSDPGLDQLIEPSAQTLRICTTDAFTDCASRERVQWMQDSYLHGKAAAYAFGDTLVLRRVLFQGAQNALPDGRINGFMPSERTGCAFASSSLVWIHLLVDYWLFSGDQEGVERLLPTLQRLLPFIATQTNEEGLIDQWPSAQFWDWAPIEDAGCLLLTNAFYIWALERLGAHSIFQSALESGCEGQLKSLREAAHQRFWESDRGLYCDKVETEAGEGRLYSQHANVLAILSGICPQEARNELLRQVIHPDNLGPVPAGEHAKWAKGRPESGPLVPVGTLWFAHFICQALFECEMTDEAIQQMHFHWGPFAGDPTFPETRVTEGNTTQCHAWASGPSVLLPAYILGLRPVGPGWSKVEVVPQFGPLTKASGFVATPHGPIRVEWNRADDANPILVDAPEGVEVIK